jgi:hypothetical protein
MGTYRISTTAGRQPRRRATSAIAALAITGLLAACTAASAGAVRQAPAPGRYPTGAGAAVQANTSPETQQSLRKEHVGTGAASTVTKPSKAISERETLRAEHRPGTK